MKNICVYASKYREFTSRQTAHRFKQTQRQFTSRPNASLQAHPTPVYKQTDPTPVYKQTQRQFTSRQTAHRFKQTQRQFTSRPNASLQADRTRIASSRPNASLQADRTCIASSRPNASLQADPTSVYQQTQRQFTGRQNAHRFKQTQRQCIFYVGCIKTPRPSVMWYSSLVLPISLRNLSGLFSPRETSENSALFLSQVYTCNSVFIK